MEEKEVTIVLRPASCLPFLAMFLEIDVFIRIQYQGIILLFYNDRHKDFQTCLNIPEVNGISFLHL